MERLRELRMANGSTQKQMADYLHIDRTTYVKYERGSIIPNVEIIQKIAEFFSVSVDYLLGRTEQSSAVSAEKAVPFPSAYGGDAGETPSPFALDIARKFDQLDEHSKAIVSALIDMELKRPAPSMHDHFQAVYDAEYASAIDDLLEAKQ